MHAAPQKPGSGVIESRRSGVAALNFTGGPRDVINPGSRRRPDGAITVNGNAAIRQLGTRGGRHESAAILEAPGGVIDSMSGATASGRCNGSAVEGEESRLTRPSPALRGGGGPLGASALFFKGSERTCSASTRKFPAFGDALPFTFRFPSRKEGSALVVCLPMARACVRARVRARGALTCGRIAARAGVRVPMHALPRSAQRVQCCDVMLSLSAEVCILEFLLHHESNER